MLIKSIDRHAVDRDFNFLCIKELAVFSCLAQPHDDARFLVDDEIFIILVSR